MLNFLEEASSKAKCKYRERYLHLASIRRNLHALIGILHSTGYLLSLHTQLSHLFQDSTCNYRRLLHVHLVHLQVALFHA